MSIAIYLSFTFIYWHDETMTFAIPHKQKDITMRKTSFYLA